MSNLTNHTSVLPVSEMAENLIGSEIIRLAGEIRERASRGQRIFNFTIGDFDPAVFPIPEKLTSEIIKAYEAGHTNYPPANGMAELRKSLARMIRERQGLDYPENDFLVAGGARPLIYALYQVILDPNDTVVFPVPSWNNNHYTHMGRGRMVSIETLPENNFMPTADELRPHLSGASLLALCSPQNPTGTVFTPEQLADICRLVLEENAKRTSGEKPLYVMYDQIYWQLTAPGFDHFDPVSLFPEMRPYTIYVDGLSKSLAATGVRVGWAFGPAKVIDKMKSILGHIGAWAPKAEQVASAGFMNDDAAVDAYMEWINTAVLDRLNAFHEGFQSLKKEGHSVDSIRPQGAIYLTVKIDLNGKTTPEGQLLRNPINTTAMLLDKCGLALVPFKAFGASDSSVWYRLSVGTSRTEEIPEVFRVLRETLSSLS
jgi:aspartate aminotransferase